MRYPSFRSRGLASVLILFLCALPIQAKASELVRAKIERIDVLIEKSNGLIASWNATLENSDSIMADLDDAIDSKDYSSVSSLQARSSEVRKSFGANNEVWAKLKAEELFECSKIDIAPLNSDLYFSVEDACFELADANEEALIAKNLSESEHSKVDSILEEFSGKAAANAKKPTAKATVKATPKAIVKVAAPKKVTCKKGSLVRVFDGVKCPPGYVKK